MTAWKLPLGLAACALLAATSEPAFAQADAPVADAPVIAEPQAQPPAPVYPAPVYPAPVYPGATYSTPNYPVPAYPAPAAPYAMPAPGQIPAQPAAYPPEYQQARADWVSECADRYRRDRRDGSGGLIGGLLGAVIGGVAGNRIDDDGDRLAGTLIGAGVGGVAGAVIGTLAGKSGRRKLDAEAASWCEDYLARRSAAPTYGHGYGYGQPVMMVPVMVPKRGNCPEEVIEEVAEEPRPISRYIPLRPAPDKRIRLAPAKTKYIKSQ